VSQQAFERAVAALSHRERTSVELAAWLAERGFEPTDVDQGISRLIDAGAIDDERFAARFASDKRELRGWGPERIREALSGRGLDSTLIEAALAGDHHSDQLERAIELLQRRAERVVDGHARARAVAYLARRGYNVEVAHDAARAVERRAA
jgi:regulatory protein